MSGREKVGPSRVGSTDLPLIPGIMQYLECAKGEENRPSNPLWGLCQEI